MKKQTWPKLKKQTKPKWITEMNVIVTFLINILTQPRPSPLTFQRLDTTKNDQMSNVLYLECD